MHSLEVEKIVQERFFLNLLNQEEGFETTAIKTYQDLVYLRYFEVIKNNFPLFIEQIDEKVLEDSIKSFMQDTPQTPFIWQMPKDYIKFLKKQKYFGQNSYIYELLYFDWIEVELHKKGQQFENEEGKFSFKDTYKLSKSAKIKRFKYDIINKNFTHQEENFVVIYYDFQTDEVVYRQINQLIYELLKRLNKKQILSKILKQLCIENDIDFKQAKQLLNEPLEELYLNNVFV